MRTMYFDMVERRRKALAAKLDAGGLSPEEARVLKICCRFVGKYLMQRGTGEPGGPDADLVYEALHYFSLVSGDGRDVFPLRPKS